MNKQIHDAIQMEQDHGRQKWGGGDPAHDLSIDDDAWAQYIETHNERARVSVGMERRQHLIKVAGLAVSAIEAFDAIRAERSSGNDNTTGANGGSLH